MSINYTSPLRTLLHSQAQLLNEQLGMTFKEFVEKCQEFDPDLTKEIIVGEILDVGSAVESFWNAIVRAGALAVGVNYYIFETYPEDDE